MMSTSELKKTIQNKRLLTKKDFIEKIIEPHNKKDLSKMKISELRELYKITHLIDGNLKDMRGHCFGCLASLRHDYTSNLNKNYCLDCL
jgi:hypothetical protein